MKKSVILVIILIYIISIVLVGFLGLKMRVYDPVIYVDEIICTSENYKDKTDDPNFGADGYISVSYTSGVTVLLKCDIKPENATHKTLEYIFDPKDEIYKVTKLPDGTATVEFFKPGSVDITVRTTDGKTTSLVIRILASDNSQFFD